MTIDHDGKLKMYGMRFSGELYRDLGGEKGMHEFVLDRYPKARDVKVDWVRLCCTWKMLDDDFKKETVNE